MKIKKLEEKKLIEADEEKDITLSEINPQTDSVEDIADAVQGSAESFLLKNVYCPS